MTETRIRWDKGAEAEITAWFGYVGTISQHVFQILRPVASNLSGTRYDEWVLCATFIGAGKARYAESSDPEAAVAELKAEAESWLSEFVSSLGAIFPADLRETIQSQRDDRNTAGNDYTGEGKFDQAERCWGWTDALDWVTALLDRESPTGTEG